MSKITERNNDRSTIATWGSASLSPTDDVVVGSFATWTLVFTVGAYAMDVGGGLKIGTRRQADFGAPQFDDPAGDNFTTVTCSREGSRFETTFDPRGHKRPFNAVAVIRLAAGPLYPGDTVTVVLGDRSRGSRGLQVQSFPETASDFAVFVDPLSSGEYKRVYCTSPNFRIRSGPAETFTAVAPTIVEAGKPFRVQVRANDRFGNPTPVDAPGLTLDADPPVVVNLRRETGRATWIDGVMLDGAGVRRLALEDGDGVLAVTNPVVVREHADGIICWGDTQAQTASTVGVGTPDEYFAYARDCAAIDFTTHQGNDFILSDADLEEVRLAARKYNDPGRFVAFFGWEWSGPTGTGGDRNVLFLDDEGPIYRSSHWQLSGDEVPPDAGATECVHARDLQARMREYMAETGRKVIMVPHIGGRRSDFEAQDPELEPVFEICSNHGIFEWRLHEFLRAGVRVGVVGASDDHTCRPGLAWPSTPEMTILGGLGAVWSRELTRRGNLRRIDGPALLRHHGRAHVPGGGGRRSAHGTGVRDRRPTFDLRGRARHRAHRGRHVVRSEPRAGAIQAESEGPRHDPAPRDLVRRQRTGPRPLHELARGATHRRRPHRGGPAAQHLHRQVRHHGTE